MKVELKDNIWIEGFNKQLNDEDLSRYDSIYLSKNIVIYRGKTSEIPEELAKECADCFRNEYYLDYSADIDFLFEFKTAKESIQSACQSEFCIIYKTR